MNCEQTVDNRYSIEDHMVATHHNKKSFSCNECGQDFVSKWRVNKHMTIHQDMPKGNAIILTME